MSSVTIQYGLRSLKVKVGPQTAVNELLEKAISHFQLDDSATYGLFHNNREVSYGLPFRLLNLPSGAKFTLQTTKSPKSADINVKVQFINSFFDKNSIVKKFKNGSTIKEAIDLVSDDLKVDIFNEDYSLKFQSLNRAVELHQIETTTLAQLGVENNGILRVSFTSNKPVTNHTIPAKAQPIPQPKIETVEKDTINEPKQVIEDDVKKPIKTHEEFKQTSPTQLNVDNIEQTPSIADSSPPIEKSPESTSSLEEQASQHVYVYKPSSNPIETFEPDESFYEVTVSHARQYQNILSQRSHETNKQRKLRLESTKKHISNIEIRVKFPDNSTLQVNFKPNDTFENLYNFVRDTLIEPSLNFTLRVPYPPRDLEVNDEELHQNLEARNLLLFHSEEDIKPPFLKPEYSAKAQDFTEAEDVKLDLSRHLLKDDNDEVDDDGKIQNGVLPKKKHKDISNSSSLNSTNDTKNTGKTPKWLKFGKK